MSDVIDVTPTALGKTPEELAGLKNMTMVVYALQALAFLWGVTAIIGVVVNYVKRDDTHGTVYESHFQWQIRTFWWSLLWGVVGASVQPPALSPICLNTVTFRPSALSRVSRM